MKLLDWWVRWERLRCWPRCWSTRTQASRDVVSDLVTATGWRAGRRLAGDLASRAPDGVRRSRDRDPVTTASSTCGVSRSLACRRPSAGTRLRAERHPAAGDSSANCFGRASMARTCRRSGAAVGSWPVARRWDSGFDRGRDRWCAWQLKGRRRAARFQRTARRPRTGGADHAADRVAVRPRHRFAREPLADRWPPALVACRWPRAPTAIAGRGGHAGFTGWRRGAGAAARRVGAALRRGRASRQGAARRIDHARGGQDPRRGRGRGPEVIDVCDFAVGLSRQL